MNRLLVLLLTLASCAPAPLMDADANDTDAPAQADTRLSLGRDVPTTTDVTGDAATAPDVVVDATDASDATDATDADAAPADSGPTQDDAMPDVSDAALQDAAPQCASACAAHTPESCALMPAWPATQCVVIDRYVGLGADSGWFDIPTCCVAVSSVSVCEAFGCALPAPWTGETAADGQAYCCYQPTPQT